MELQKPKSAKLKTASSDPSPDDELAGPSSSSRQPAQLSEFEDDILPITPLPPGPTDGELPSYDDANTEPPPFSVYSASQRFAGMKGRLISHDAHLNSDTEALYQWIITQASKKPRPLLRIKGTHDSGNNKVTDFYIQVDLTTWIKDSHTIGPVSAAVKRRRGTVFEYLGDSEAGKTARDWCTEYINSTWWLKEFLVRKYVIGLEEQYLHDRIKQIIRAAGYRNRIEVSVLVHHRSVQLAPDNWFARLRYSWVRWLFYLSFLWILTWPILRLLTKRWEVVEAHFPARSGSAVTFVNRWEWVIGRVVTSRKKIYSVCTPQYLKWLELQEIEAAKIAQQKARERAERWEQRKSKLRSFIGKQDPTTKTAQ